MSLIFLLDSDEEVVVESGALVSVGNAISAVAAVRRTVKIQCISRASSSSRVRAAVAPKCLSRGAGRAATTKINVGPKLVGRAGSLARFTKRSVLIRCVSRGSGLAAISKSSARVKFTSRAGSASATSHPIISIHFSDLARARDSLKAKIGIQTHSIANSASYLNKYKVTAKFASRASALPAASHTAIKARAAAVGRAVAALRAAGAVHAALVSRSGSIARVRANVGVKLPSTGRSRNDFDVGLKFASAASSASRVTRAVGKVHATLPSQGRAASAVVDRRVTARLADQGRAIAAIGSKQRLSVRLIGRAGASSAILDRFIERTRFASSGRVRSIITDFDSGAGARLTSTAGAASGINKRTVRAKFASRGRGAAYFVGVPPIAKLSDQARSRSAVIDISVGAKLVSRATAVAKLAKFKKVRELDLASLNRAQSRIVKRRVAVHVSSRGRAFASLHVSPPLGRLASQAKAHSVFAKPTIYAKFVSRAPARAGILDRTIEPRLAALGRSQSAIRKRRIAASDFISIATPHSAILDRTTRAKFASRAQSKAAYTSPAIVTSLRSIAAAKSAVARRTVAIHAFSSAGTRSWLDYRPFFASQAGAHSVSAAQFELTIHCASRAGSFSWADYLDERLEIHCFVSEVVITARFASPATLLFQAASVVDVTTYLGSDASGRTCEAA